MSTSPAPQCQVILALAHLLRQRSPSYECEKDALLDASVRFATALSHQHENSSLEGAMEAMEVDREAEEEEEGEVHVVLTGSPRPTFAETNAWLLEANADGGNDADAAATAVNAPGERNPSFRGSYTILDNVTPMKAERTDDISTDGSDDGEGGARSLRDLLSECAHGDVGAGGVAGGDDDGSDDDENESGGNEGPMVGRAVVNAVSRTRGVGLRSSRAKLLQGTIDRPLWDQRRWTDGECLFSELVDKIGLESFENVGVAGSHLHHGVGAGSEGADAAAGGGELRRSKLGTTGLRLRKTSDLSAHLITVPAAGPQSGPSEEMPGMEEDTAEEIARGILRCLKRKKSPPASKVYLILPPDGGRDEATREAVSTGMAAAWKKLERYNDMIGAPKLMADASLEFVDVSV